MGGKLHLNLNTNGIPIANKYHEGKMKRTLKRELKVPVIVEKKLFGCVDFSMLPLERVDSCCWQQRWDRKLTRRLITEKRVVAGGGLKGQSRVPMLVRSLAGAPADGKV